MLTKGGEILTRAGNPLRYGSIGNGIKTILTDSSYANIPHGASINFNIGNDFSFYILLNPRSLTNLNNVIVSKRETLGGGQYRGILIDAVGTTAKRLYFQLSDGASLIQVFSPIDSLAVGKLSSICIVKSTTNPNNFKIYTDKAEGQAVLTNTGVFTNIQNLLAMTIGGSVPSSIYASFNFFRFMVFDKALSQAEVSQLSDSYGNDISGISTNIVVNIPFQEKTGTNVKDLSIYNHAVTLVNFANTALGVSNQHIDKNGNGITV